MILIPTEAPPAPDWWADLPQHIREDVVAYLNAAGHGIAWTTA